MSLIIQIQIWRAYNEFIDLFGDNMEVHKIGQKPWATSTQTGPVLAKNISQFGVPTVSSFQSGINKTTLFLKTVDKEEVRTTILSYRSKSQLNVDNINNSYF